MMTLQSKPFRILAIAPSSRGFGFVILEGEETLVDWGVKQADGNKNAQSLAKIRKLLTHYQPELVVLQNTSSEHCRRSPRIKALTKRIRAAVIKRKIKVALFSHEQVRGVFFDNGLGTKDRLAEILAKKFPEQLGSILPPKRRAWMSEHYRMPIFDAVGLAVVFRVKRANKKSCPYLNSP